MGQNVRRRFVQTLRCLYALNPTEFADRARNIQGRERKYFSEDREGMTRPSNIGSSESPYWVETHCSTREKKGRLDEVMNNLGYSARMIQQATDKLR